MRNKIINNPPINLDASEGVVKSEAVSNGKKNVNNFGKAMWGSLNGKNQLMLKVKSSNAARI